LLHTARDLDEHLDQLNTALRNGARDSVRSRRFVEAFIRPRGVGVAATPLFADEIEKLAATRPQPTMEPAGAYVLRAALMPLASFFALPAAEPLVASAHERSIADRQRAHRERVAEAWRVKEEHEADEQRVKQARLAARQRRKAQRAAEWRRTKTMKKLTHRIRKRIGLPPIVNRES
jgi:hypothetical protein